MPLAGNLHHCCLSTPENLWSGDVAGDSLGQTPDSFAPGNHRARCRAFWLWICTLATGQQGQQSHAKSQCGIHLCKGAQLTPAAAGTRQVGLVVAGRIQLDRGKDHATEPKGCQPPGGTWGSLGLKLTSRLQRLVLLETIDVSKAGMHSTAPYWDPGLPQAPPPNLQR